MLRDLDAVVVVGGEGDSVDDFDACFRDGVGNRGERGVSFARVVLVAVAATS